MHTTHTAQAVRGIGTPEHPAQTAKPVRIQLYKGVCCVTFLKGHDGPAVNSVNYFDVPYDRHTAQKHRLLRITHKSRACRASCKEKATYR